jgi:hypothetical protein
MPADLKAAMAFVPELGEALDKMPRANFHDYEADLAVRNEALLRLRRLIERNGGKVDAHWHGAAIRLHGLRATSTSSLTDACYNWIAQVTRKAQAADAPAGAA